MGITDVARGLLARPKPPVTLDATVWVWWADDHLAAVRAGPEGEVVPVLFDAWPVLSTTDTGDRRSWDALLTALDHPAASMRVAAAIPASWGPARRTGWHQAASDGGITELVTIPASEAIGGAARAGGIEAGAVWVAATVGDDTTHITALPSMNDPDEAAVPGVLAQRSTKATGAAGLARAIAETLYAADVLGPPAAIVLTGDPAVTHRLVHRMADVAGAEIPLTDLTPLALATAVAEVDTTRQDATVVPPTRPTSPGVMATITAGVLAVWLTASITTTAAPAYGTNIAVFSPGHLAVAATAVAVAVAMVAASMLTVQLRLARGGVWDWQVAGTWLTGGAIAGTVAAVTCGLLLASIQGVAAGPSIAWTLLPVAPVMAVYAGIGLLLQARPDPPPQWRIWPPMLAVILAAVAVLVLHTVEPLFSDMPTTTALAARAAFMVLAAATGLAATSNPWPATGIAIALGITYVLTVSASTGTVACLLFIAAVSIRAAISLARQLADHRASRRPITTPPPEATSVATRLATGH